MFSYETFRDWFHAQGLVIRNQQKPEKLASRCWDYQQEIIEKLKKKNELLEQSNEFYSNEINWIQIINGTYNLGKIWIYSDYENRFLNNSITTENGAFARAVKEQVDRIVV